jgi:hypothetical protein
MASRSSVNLKLFDSLAPKFAKCRLISQLLQSVRWIASERAKTAAAGPDALGADTVGATVVADWADRSSGGKSRQNHEGDRETAEHGSEVED